MHVSQQQTSRADGPDGDGRDHGGQVGGGPARDRQERRADPDGADGDGDPRLASLTASLAARLAPVCRHLDAAAFDALVTRIARTQLRWAEQDGHA